MKISSKKIGGILLASFCMSATVFPRLAVSADDFEAYKKQQQQGTQKIKAEFQEYKEKQDKEFADFLKTQWSEFETYSGKVRIKEPKPKQIPIVAAPKAPVAPIPSPAVPAPAPVAPVPSPVVIAPVIQPITPPPAPPQPKPVPLAADTLEIMFYGNAVRFRT